MFGNALLLLIIILPTVEIITFISLGKRWKKDGRFRENHSEIATVLCVIAIAVTINLLISSDYRRSNVDVSPMAELTTDEIYMLESVVEDFGRYDFITRFDATDMDTNQKVTMIYEFRWRNPDSESDSSLGVSILFYIEESEAISHLGFAKKYLSEGRYKTIKYSNNTEAALFHTKLGRNEYFRSSGWSQSTYIRFGNALMIIYGGGSGGDPTAFIEWLCDLVGST